MFRSIVKQQRLIALFLFGALLFNYPLLALFSRPGEVFGIPLLYIVHLRRVGALRGPARARRRAQSVASARDAPGSAMLQSFVIVPVALAYIGVLFAIARFGDRRADQGRSIIANPYIYALSLGVYATAWTFYGSVGRAAADGVGFLPIYIGPTLMMALWWLVLRKIVRISKANRITSLADFVSSRYGKSALIAGLVTVIAVIGVLPYIALQLKAVSHSYTILTRYPDIAAAGALETAPIGADTAFWVALLLAVFTILFGTRHLDASERHEGLVAAIAFESLVKLVAFLVVGAFVTWGIHNGLADIFARSQSHPRLAPLFAPLGGAGGSYASWAWLTVLSMLAIVFLPRQFQVAVVENVDENHLTKAIWLFPLYMLAMNLFVVPVAFGGVLHFSATAVDPDTFVLTLPMAEKQEAIALLVFIGGLSAATGMVIVETIALSTMVCNDLVMPVLLRMRSMGLARRENLTGLLLGIRRGAIVAVILLGYLYFRLAGEAYALVAIGLISFAAVAQFAPATLGGIYWKGATRAGALAGLSAGFAVWLYTLLLPSFAKSGWLPASFLEHGPFGIELLRAVRAVRSRRSQRHHARDAVEHDRQCRRVRAGLGADDADGGRAGAGRPLRRRVPARRRRAGRPPVEGHRIAARPARVAGPVPRRRARRGRVRRIRSAARTHGVGRGAGRCRTRAVRRDRARGRDRRRLGADHGGLDRQGRRARPATRCARCSTRPRRSSPTATSCVRNRPSSKRPRPSSARPTSACRSSTA